MKIIATFFVLFFTIINGVLGANIELSSDATQVQIGESFDIVIDVYPEEGEEVSIDTITGIEDFRFLGQSRSQRFVNINGDTQSQTQLYLTLIAQKQGVFTLGPVIAIASGNELSSNTIEIEVIDMNSVGNTQNIDASEVSSDILDIFDTSDRKISFNYLPFIIAGFFIVFFILIKKLMKKPKPETVSVPEPEISQNDRLISELKSLKRKSSKLEKTDFYSDFNNIMREFFALLGYKNTEKMTLREISKLGIENKNILSIFKESYTKEFDDKKDMLEQRKKMIDDFIQELKK